MAAHLQRQAWQYGRGLVQARVNVTTCATLIMLLAISAAPAAALEYRGRSHEAIGGAALALQDTALVITGIGGSGQDGVLIEAGGIFSFEAFMSAINSTSNSVINYMAITNVDTLGHGQLSQVAGDSTRLSAGFRNLTTASSVRVDASLSGTLVRSVILPATLPAAPAGSLRPIVTWGAPGGIFGGGISLVYDPFTKICKIDGMRWPGGSLTGYIAGDNTSVTFDHIVVTPLAALTSVPEKLTEVRITAANRSQLRIETERVVESTVSAPGLSSVGLWVVAILLGLSGLVATSKIASGPERQRGR